MTKYLLLVFLLLPLPALALDSLVLTDTTIVTFDAPNPAPVGIPGELLEGVFQGIDFDSGQWKWEDAFHVNTTNHIYFSSSSGTSRKFRFAEGPKVLVSLSAASQTIGTLTLSDNRGQTQTAAIGKTEVQPVATEWALPSDTVTLDFTEGWELLVDDIAYSSWLITGNEPSPAQAGDTSLAISPNPCNPEARFIFSVSKPGRVELAIYTLKGEKISTLFDTQMPAGRFSVNWNGARQSSGVYLVRLKAGNAAVQRRLILIR